MRTILSVIAVLLLAIGAWWLYANPAMAPEVVDLERSAPTNFIERGVVTVDGPGQEPGMPYLAYEAPGAPALSEKLTFDSLSVCVSPDGATSCGAMGATMDMSFGGKTVVIEGGRSEDGVLVRKMQEVREGETGFPLPEPGSVFISWPQAVSILEQCEVEMAMQTHALDVYLTLADDSRVRAVEPVIDEVFRVLEQTRETCGTIPVATE